MKQIEKSFFDTVSVGDIIGGSLHYSYLASAVFFRVIQKKGKTTLICEQLTAITEYTGYNTKVISCDVNNVKCHNVKLRCGKYSAKYDCYNLHKLTERLYFEGSDSD